MYAYQNPNHVIITYHAPSYYDLFSLGPKLTLLPIDKIISYHVMLSSYVIDHIMLCYISYMLSYHVILCLGGSKIDSSPRLHVFDVFDQRLSEIIHPSDDLLGVGLAWRR